MHKTRLHHLLSGDGFQPTPLILSPLLADLYQLGQVQLKLESQRPLGNFKVLGGYHAALNALMKATESPCLEALQRLGASLPGLICASDGNHGLAVAAAAGEAGTSALIYLPSSVKTSRIERIESLGGRVERVPGTYEDAVKQASLAASAGRGILIPDTTDNPDDPVVNDVMAGYTRITSELTHQLQSNTFCPPTHVLVQAGVGGLAAAIAKGIQPSLAQPGHILVVEPETAACVKLGLEMGRPVLFPGNLETCAQMLSCGLASAPALMTLQQYAAQSVTVNEQQLRNAATALKQSDGITCSISAAAGLAGLIQIASDPLLRARYQLNSSSVVLLFVTEGAE